MSVAPGVVGEFAEEGCDGVCREAVIGLVWVAVKAAQRSACEYCPEGHVSAWGGMGLATWVTMTAIRWFAWGPAAGRSLCRGTPHCSHAALTRLSPKYTQLA